MELHTSNNLVTVLTPVYNRRELIKKLYKSLLQQTMKQFTWLIIDDGSVDEIENEVIDWKNEAEFSIIYYRKENGGKHTALNVGFQMVETSLTFIVDSDDVLTPNAIREIQNDWNGISNKENVAGISYLRGNSENRVIGSYFPKEGVYNEIDMRYRLGVRGDKAEVWRSDILKEYSFPVFKEEKFQGENYIWWQIACKYNLMYLNKIIYITEYLEEGLTKSGRKLRVSCPLGGMENSKKGFNKKFPLKERIKRGVLYNCYGFFAGCSMKKRMLNSEKHEFLVGITYIPGLIVYLLWKKYLV